MNLHTPPALPRRLRLIGKLPCATFLVALCTLIAVLPAAGQTAQAASHGDNRAQAALHIQAQVVAVTYATSPRTSTSPTNDAGSVIYSLSPRQAGITVVEEIRILSRGEIAAWHGRLAVQDAILKTVTIVPQ
jgi:hypothetical protein